MATLFPCPFGALVTRMFRELDARQQIFDLPASAFVLGDPAFDCSVTFHGRAVGSPFGPAAGPHTQLAQNLVLSWLAGGRILELKTVQVKDRLAIPRPCIDARTIGFNVEWSQELTLEQSLEEYVKGSMLIQMLVASGRLAMAPGFDRFAMDMSVGYDLRGITSKRVRRFIHELRNAQPVIDRLRRQIPREWRPLADVPFEPCIAPSVTLSTFHGCPPDEIERIVRFLLREAGLPTVVKLNPTLLGYDDTSGLLHDTLGYSDVRLSRDAFENDLQWDDMCELVHRLGHAAREEGLGFGVKLTNTLVVQNEGDFLPASEPRKYLSGPPLHVLAMHLVGRFRREFGSRFPISFSAGIDPTNFADAVALGLTPITVCTDLLKPGGYARGRKYFRELAYRMEAAGAGTLSEFVVRAYGLGARAVGRAGAARCVAEATLLNTEHYVRQVATQGRYARANHSRPPRKIGRPLSLFDCLACDKCVTACPNDANFTLELPQEGIRRETATHENGPWQIRVDGTLPVTAPHQIANFADLCNECGNCDVVCPEDGGPWHAKPRFFGSAKSWRRGAPGDGFLLERTRSADVMRARLAGDEYTVEFDAGRIHYAGEDFSLSFADDDALATIAGEATGDVDLTPLHLMRALRRAVLGSPNNFVSALLSEDR